MTDKWTHGTPAFLKADPGQIGICTGRSRMHDDSLMVQISFSNRPPSYVPEYELSSPNLIGLIDDGQQIKQGMFGRSSDLRRELTHIQLSGRLANLVYSMDTTNTDFYPYQYKPVLSFLESPSKALLIADEVGLGKTIEAGLIWTELRARFDARRLLIVCPKMLCSKWKKELKERFGIEGQIVNAAELLEELQNTTRESMPDARALITSLQGIRPPKGWQSDSYPTSPRGKLAKFLEASAGEDPIIDLTVIDEAHYLRNQKTSTYDAGHLLKGASEHLVLLSATPINLKNEDLFSLLNIVDPENFEYKEQFESILRSNTPLIEAKNSILNRETSVQAIKDVLLYAQQNFRLRKSKQLQAIVESMSELKDENLNEQKRVEIADKLDRVNLLAKAVTRTTKAEATPNRVIRVAKYQNVQMSNPESDFYHLVTESIRDYACDNAISDSFILATPQRMLSSCMYAAAKSWGAISDDFEEFVYEDFGQEYEEEPKSDFIAHLLDNINHQFNLQSLKDNDSKFNELLRIVKEYILEYPDQKVILFSYYRETLRYLHDRLNDEGIESHVLMGGMSKDKSEIIEDFKKSKSKILLSTDVASEGVDLQFSRFLINYDLPWNPMKVEQRIGRIDRIGQKSESINIWNLVYEGTIDSRILSRLYERLELFKKSLGNIEAIIGEEIKSLTTNLLTGKLSPEEEQRRIDQTALALENRRNQEEQLERQASELIAHSGYILQKVHAAHDFSKRITEKDLLTYVQDYLNKYSQGHIFQQDNQNELKFQIKLSPQIASIFDDFLRRKRSISATKLATGALIDCLFSNKAQKNPPGHEVLSQFHPLIKFISEEIKKNNEVPSGLICLKLSSNAKELKTVIHKGQYAFAIQKWSFEGIRTEEILKSRVINLQTHDLLGDEISQEIINAARISGHDWPEAANDLNIEPAIDTMVACELQLRNDFDTELVIKKAENEDRVNFQRDSIASYLDKKLQIENNRILSLSSGTKNKGLIVAAENTKKKLQEKFNVKDQILLNQLNIESKLELLCKGALLIY